MSRITSTIPQSQELTFQCSYRPPISNETELQNNALLLYARWCVKAALSIPTDAGTRNHTDSRNSVFPLTSANRDATLSAPSNGVLKGVE